MKSVDVRDRIEVARYWLRNVGRPYPPLETVRLAAVAELQRNPSITTYKFKGGNEVRRRPGDPWKRFQEVVAQLGNAFESMARSLRSIDLIGDSEPVPTDAV